MWNNAAGQYNLGSMYKDKLGVEQDCKQACKLYKLVAEQGNRLAQLNLAYMYKMGLGMDKNYTMALKLYK